MEKRIIKIYMKKVKKPKLPLHLGENLKKWRIKNGYSLDDVAYNAGLSKSYLSQLETGHSKHPSVETAFLLWSVVSNDIKITFQDFIFNPFAEKTLNFVLNKKKYEQKR